MDNLETLDKVKLLKDRLARDGIDKKVDLTAKNSLNEIGKKYILKDLVYV